MTPLEREATSSKIRAASIPLRFPPVRGLGGWMRANGSIEIRIGASKMSSDPTSWTALKAAIRDWSNRDDRETINEDDIPF